MFNFLLTIRSKTLQLASFYFFLLSSLSVHVTTNPHLFDISIKKIHICPNLLVIRTPFLVVCYVVCVYVMRRNEMVVCVGLNTEMYQMYMIMYLRVQKVKWW